MKFQGKYKKDGFDFGDNRNRILKHCEFNAGKKFILEDFTEESRDQRKFYHGAVLTLWVYLDGKDYRNGDLIDMYHDVAKKEFNAAIVVTKIKGEQKRVRIGKSTKGELNSGYLEAIIENLEEEYGIDRTKCLDPKDYDYFKDKIFMEGNYDTYIDYLKDLKRIPLIHT